MHRESNEITQFQAQSITKWDADIVKMQEIHQDDSECKKVLDSFYKGSSKAIRTNGRRVFNALTAMKREMRQHLTYKNNQLIEIDCANSQPLLLVNELINARYDVEPELVDIMQTGDFYSIFGDDDRDRRKRSVYSFFYSKEIDKEHSVFKTLNEKFPKFTQSLIDYSDDVDVAKHLQEIESRIWIDKISHALMLAEIPHATIHDSVVVQSHSDSNYVLDLIQYSYNGADPKLHITTLDDKPVKIERKPSDRMRKYFDKAIKRRFVFWYFTDRGTRFDIQKVLSLLNDGGFYRYYTTDQEYIFVRKVNNMVEHIDMSKVRRYVMDYVREYGSQTIRRSFEQQHTNVLSSPNMMLMDAIDIPFFEGEKGNSYVFYSDKIARITGDDISSIEYKDFNHPIWKSRMLKRKFPPTMSKKPGDFELFFNKVIREPKNKTYVMQVLGYALHGYRSLDYQKAIIFNDQNIDDESKGRTGKGVIAQALSKFLATVSENGKAFNALKTFSYQNINLYTQMFVIQDTKQGFDLEDLFSFLTDGIYIEKKNQPPFRIEPERMPIVVITTNLGVKGSDDSHKGRRLDVVLDKHYTAKYRPIHDFKREFWRGWPEDDEQWTLFDAFMLRCASKFLRDGIDVFEDTNLAIKQLSAETHPDFEEFCDEYIKPGAEVNRTELLEKWRDKSGYTKFTKSNLTKWVNKYAVLKSINVEVDKRNDNYSILSENVPVVPVRTDALF